MVKIYKKISVIKSAMLVILAILMILLCFVGGKSIAKAKDNELDVSTGDTITNYYMIIPLKGASMAMKSKGFMNDNWGDFKAWERTNKNVNVVFRFTDILYSDKNTNEEMAVICTTTASINFPGSQTVNQKISFNKSLTINIAEKYYNYFKYMKDTGKGDYTKFKVSLFFNGVGVPLYKGGFDTEENNIFNYDIVLDTKELPPGSDDPSDPNFDLGDNNGLTPSERIKGLTEKLFNFLTGIFKWGITYSQFCLYLKIGGIVLVALIVLPIVIKIVKRLYEAIVS